MYDDVVDDVADADVADADVTYGGVADVVIVQPGGQLGDLARRSILEGAQKRDKALSEVEAAQVVRRHALELEVQYKEKMSKEFLTERIATLFPDENFYFFQLKDNEAD